jgi:hypothetical protein
LCGFHLTLPNNARREVLPNIFQSANAANNERNSSSTASGDASVRATSSVSNAR